MSGGHEAGGIDILIQRPLPLILHIKQVHKSLPLFLFTPHPLFHAVSMINLVTMRAASLLLVALGGALAVQDTEPLAPAAALSVSSGATCVCLSSFLSNETHIVVYPNSRAYLALHCFFYKQCLW